MFSNLSLKEGYLEVRIRQYFPFHIGSVLIFLKEWAIINDQEETYPKDYAIIHESHIKMGKLRNFGGDFDYMRYL